MSWWHDDITGYHEKGTDGTHVGKSDLNDVHVVTMRQVSIDQIIQETVTNACRDEDR